MLWVVNDSRMIGKPSVASMSLSGGASRTMNKTVKVVWAEWVERDRDATDE